jgi:hypothetical protein
LVRILGIDPGLATGTAIFDTETLSFIRMDELQQGIDGFKVPFLTLAASGTLEVEHIVAEKFTLRSSNKFTADLHGVEILGWLYGEKHIVRSRCPEPSQHMQLTRLRKKKDNYAESVVTKLMKRDKYRIGKGHTRMAGSVAMWYAAMILKDRSVLELLKPKDLK